MAALTRLLIAAALADRELQSLFGLLTGRPPHSMVEGQDWPQLMAATGRHHPCYQDIVLLAVPVAWGISGSVQPGLHDWAVQTAAQMPWLRYVPVLSEPQPADGWTGRTGFVHQAVLQDLPDLSGHEVYACGAPVMVAAAQHDLIALCGLPAEAFYADAFTSEADKHPAAP